jgi:hypothetical protein
MNFYKFNILIDKEKFDYLNSSLTSEESNNLDKIKAENLDHWKSDKELVSYFLISDEDIEYIKEIFYSREIRFKYKNITESVLNGDLNFDDKYFDKIKKDYIDNNLTIDIILDKINKKGINSLNDFDKRILQSFS